MTAPSSTLGWARGMVATIAMSNLETVMATGWAANVLALSLPNEAASK